MAQEKHKRGQKIIFLFDENNFQYFYFTSLADFIRANSPLVWEWVRGVLSLASLGYHATPKVHANGGHNKSC